MRKAIRVATLVLAGACGDDDSPTVDAPPAIPDAGATTPDAVFYYRFHSPVILSECDPQTPIAIRLPDGSRGPTRQHIHAVVRTPNGHDYGKDLVRQLLLAHEH